MIEFREVSFTYEPVKHKRRRAQSGDPKPADWGRSPDDRWALAHVSFTLNDGELFGIAGHTGSGKSTLIQLSNGLLQPTFGTVLANGHDLSDKKAAAEARRDVGVVFQYPERQLFAATVFDDVAFGPRNLGLNAQEVEERVREGLELVHLDADALGERSPFALSGGQQRRVAFAGVLAMRPTTLILDEPVAGLDPRARRSFLGLVRELHPQGNLTVAIVSHNMDDLADLCDRILVLNQGRLHALGTPAQVFADEAGMRAIGLGVPQAASLANSLAKRGFALPLDGKLPSLESLADAVAARYRETLAG
jgi:energy-coupling factor transport system ATP-binding protein